MAEKQLNKQQLEAILTNPARFIIAGAGTGKTTVVTERVKWLIAENLAQPSEILALTFTEKAAREMEERIDIALPYGYTQMWVMTFHSFCDRIYVTKDCQLTRHWLQAHDRSRLVDLLRRHLFDLDLVLYRPLGNPHKFVWLSCSILAVFKMKTLLPKTISSTPKMNFPKDIKIHGIKNCRKPLDFEI